MGKAMWKANGNPTAYGTRKYADHLGLIVRRQGNKLVLHEPRRRSESIVRGVLWSERSNSMAIIWYHLMKTDGGSRLRVINTA